MNPPFSFDVRTDQLAAAAAALHRDGIILLTDLLSAAQLQSAQHAFRSRLDRMAWNDLDGYERTELFRLMIEDILLLDQSFVDLVLHPAVLQLVQDYVGADAQLCEAKGWRSVATNREFHGWHGDSWYDDKRTTERIPRELKLALYLTDVETGGFNYLPGTQRQQVPRTINHNHYAHLREGEFVNVRGPAGTAFLFDTSAVHRQGVPILKDREAVFCCYHNPAEPIQDMDVAYYRYHPLLLNAAFLGNLTPEHMRVLGFGDRRSFLPGHRRPDPYPRFSRAMQWLWRGALEAGIASEWLGAKRAGLLRRITGRG